MCKLKLTAWLLATIFLLAGCSHAGNVENQAYALILGVDKKDISGNIELTIRIPKIGSSGGEGKGSSGTGSSSYLIISAEGKSYANALEALKWSVTRNLNLSQLKMIVVSEKLAADSDFSEIISVIAETYHLYTAARFVVCEGNAKDFISGQETVIGTRLSTEIDAMFEHYAELGYIPDVTFADLYYTLNSVYSDPMAILGFASEESKQQETAASAILKPGINLEEETDSPSSRHYLGAGIFVNNVLSEKLNAEQTLFTNLICGNLKSFSYDCDGKVYQLTPLEKPKIKTDISGQEAKIRIKIRLSAVVQDSSLKNDNLKTKLEQDIMNTIKHCQNAGVEPFGFAESAAMHFKTIREWMDFDWKNTYSTAKVEIEIKILRADS